MAEISTREKLSIEIPTEFKRWKKLDIEAAAVIDPTQQAVLTYLYTETLSANYVNASNSLVMLSLAYGKDQSDGHDVHKPDLCYPAQGFTVLEQRDFPVILKDNKSIKVRYMKTQKGQRIEPLIYWTTAGNFLYQGKFQKKLIGFKYGKDNLIPDGLILRVSTIESDSEIAIERLTDYIQDWYESMPIKQRSRYFGEQNQ